MCVEPKAATLPAVWNVTFSVNGFRSQTPQNMPPSPRTFVCMYSSNKIAIGLVPITHIACASRVHSVGLHSLARLASGWPLAMGVLCVKELYVFVCLYCKALNVLMPCHPAVQWPSIGNIWQAKCRPKLTCCLDL